VKAIFITDPLNYATHDSRTEHHTEIDTRIIPSHSEASRLRVNTSAIRAPPEVKARPILIPSKVAVRKKWSTLVDRAKPTIEKE
jgi:hypothetical protein